MKFACFADTHAHLYKEFSTITEVSGNSRLDQIISALDYMKTYCLENDIKHILFAGDMFHRRKEVNIKVFNAIYDVLSSFSKGGLELIGIPGNHDQESNEQFPEHSLYTFNRLDGITFHSRNNFQHVNENVCICCLPYCKDPEYTLLGIQEAEQFKQAYPDVQLILLAHLGVSGAMVNNMIMQDKFSVESLSPEIFKYGILGHYHRRQFLPGTNHMLYVGSTLQHSFNDEGEDKGFYVIDTNKRHHIEFIPIPSPKFVTVRNPEEMLNVDTKDFVRFLVTEDQVEEIQKTIPEDMQYRIELQKSYEETNRIDVKVGMGFDEVIVKYAGELNVEATEIGLEILKEVSEANV